MAHLTQEEAGRLAGIMGWPWNTAHGTYDHAQGGSACLFSVYALKTESPGAHTLSSDWYVTAEGMYQMMVRFEVEVVPRTDAGWIAVCKKQIRGHYDRDPRIAVARAVLANQS